MPKIDVPEDQILKSLDQLSPNARREALRRLLQTVEYLDRAIDRNRSRIETLARERGLDWESLTEEQRENLVDQILHQ